MTVIIAEGILGGGAIKILAAPNSAKTVELLIDITVSALQKMGNFTHHNLEERNTMYSCQEPFGYYYLVRTPCGHAEFEFRRAEDVLLSSVSASSASLPSPSEQKEPADQSDACSQLRRASWRQHGPSS